MNFTKALKLTEAEARTYLESIRWPEGPRCPRHDCGSADVVTLKANVDARVRPGLYRCRSCRRQFTVTVGTIFEATRIPLGKWIAAFYLVCSSKKGISALQLQRMLGLGSYKTAWHMAHRIRHAMKNEPLRSMLTGTVEIDETFVGGKAKKPQGGPRRIRDKKTPVVALIQRDGEVRTAVVPSVSPKDLRPVVQSTVDPSATLNTDGWPAYRTIGQDFAGHEWVDHSSKEYARGTVHVNTCESFFGLLKRGIHGSFHHVSRQHLHRYCDEFSFRWNTRKVSDAERVRMALGMAPGKRLMYRAPRPKK